MVAGWLRSERQKARKGRRITNLKPPGAKQAVHAPQSGFVTLLQNETAPLFMGEVWREGYLHTQGLDTSTPAGRAMFSMLSVFAEFERAILRQRIMAGLARSTKRSGRPPLDPTKVKTVEKLLRQGVSINAAAKKARVGVGSVCRIKARMPDLQQAA
jgi:hypothetical protein